MLKYTVIICVQEITNVKHLDKLLVALSHSRRSDKENIVSLKNIQKC